jgi:hypothetical protein
MYEKKQEENILIIFKTSLRIIIGLCIPGIILEVFVSELLITLLTVGVLIFLVALYLYVTRKHTSIAKYCLGLISISLCAFQITKDNNAGA